MHLPSTSPFELRHVLAAQTVGRQTVTLQLANRQWVDSFWVAALTVAAESPLPRMIDQALRKETVGGFSGTQKQHIARWSAMVISYGNQTTGEDE